MSYEFIHVKYYDLSVLYYSGQFCDIASKCLNKCMEKVNMDICTVKYVFEEESKS